MSEKCACGFGYGEDEYPDECENCGEYFCPKCMKKHLKTCKEPSEDEMKEEFEEELNELVAKYPFEIEVEVSYPKYDKLNNRIK